MKKRQKSCLAKQIQHCTEEFENKIRMYVIYVAHI